MRLRSRPSFVSIATLVLASCGGGGSQSSATGGDTDGNDSGGITRGSEDGDSTRGDEFGTVGVDDSTGTLGGVSNSGSTGDSVTDSADDTVGSHTNTNTESDSDSVTDSNGSDDSGSTGGGGPGPIPVEFPGVDQGLCAPPGLEQYCYSGAPVTYNVGVCGPGVQECVALDLDFGEWGPCVGETLPVLEVCDGVDNDCDGQVDEDLGTTMCGVGFCEHSVPNCIEGVEIECDPLDGAQPEVCNMLDDDCDNDVDEGLGDETTTCGVGQCAHEVTACENGVLPECDPFQGATNEVCDGVDNDCDGQTDEGLPSITCGVGICEHTVPSCIAGDPQICDPFEGADTETCDGLDNDCDGSTDEDQGVWTCGQNECEVTVPQCVNGVPQPPSSCQPIPGGSEICGNGVDDNCDGIDAPCAETFLVGTDTEVRPIDVIWAIDSSGSMSAEMATVEQEINDFANAMAASGSSTNLHLIADRGTGGFQICVAPPLGAAACADNPPEGFWQYDTNGTGESMVHSSNALGRIMQQSPTWIPRLQANSHKAFIVTTDDDGDDPSWNAAAGDLSETDDCGSGNITNATTGNVCRWDAPGTLNYTSMADDFSGQGGFNTFMTNFFAGAAADSDWSFYAIIGNTGTATLTGADDAYEFNTCALTVEAGVEYVKLAQDTNRLGSMISICQADWDLTGLADDITSGVPNDLYFLEGNPAGTCPMIDPSTITVVVNGIPLNPADWTYNAGTCTLQVINNVPVVGDNVVIVYQNF